MLIDIHMDDCDSRVVCEFVRSSDDLDGTTIIAMSGKLTDGQVSQLIHQGYDGALRKPFSVRQVIDSIETANAVIY